MRAQYLVIAVATPVVGGVGEDLTVLQLLQHLLAPRSFEEGIADGPGEAGQHAGADGGPAPPRREVVAGIGGPGIPPQGRPPAQRGPSAPPPPPPLPPGRQRAEPKA